MEEMDDKRFDQEIRQILERFQAPYQPEHWNMFEEKLDMASPDPDNVFDSTISDKLGSLGTSIPSNWYRMSSMLDQHAELTDEEFDERIAEKLAKVRPPYHPEYWERMEALQVNRRNRVIQFALLRTAEVMMLFLLWFNWPLGKSVVPAPDLEPHFATESIIRETADEVMTSNAISEPTAINKSNGISEASAVSKAGSGKNTANPALVAGSTIRPVYEVAISEQDAVANDISSTLFSREKIPAVQLIGMLATTGILTEESAVVEIENVSLGALPPLGSPSSLILPEDIPFYDHEKDEKKLSISPYLAADFNAINSYLSIEQLDDNRLRHLTLTPGAGVGIGFHNGPWSVHTGAGYSYKFYDPNITEQFGSINGYSELNFNKVALHVLQLPIRLQYKFREGMKTAFYVTGGASLHYIVRQEFEKPKRPISSIESIPSPVKPILEEGQYKSGNFLGRFSEASYLTADLGFGMEYKLNNDLVVYVQPTYMRMFGQGVGPNFDVIHSLSMQVGLRL